MICVPTELLTCSDVQVGAMTTLEGFVHDGQCRAGAHAKREPVPVYGRSGPLSRLRGVLRPQHQQIDAWKPAVHGGLEILCGDSHYGC